MPTISRSVEIVTIGGHVKLCPPYKGMYLRGMSEGWTLNPVPAVLRALPFDGPAAVEATDYIGLKDQRFGS